MVNLYAYRRVSRQIPARLRTASSSQNPSNTFKIVFANAVDVDDTCILILCQSWLLAFDL